MPNTVLSNIHNDLNGFNKLVKFYNEHENDFLESIDIELRDWFDANLCAVLGAILDKIHGFNDINFIFIQNAIKTILQKNNFLSFYGYPRIHDTYNTTIEYKKLKPSDSRYFNEYLENDLLRRSELPSMSDAVHDKISESIQEIFVNAQYHSETEFIYTCGQLFPKDYRLNFTIVDTGIGFARRIEKDLGYNIGSTDAIRWAITKGHTSKHGVPGGLGLDLLKEFVTENQGKIQIVSGNALYEFANGQEKFCELSGYFDGSVVSMTFKTDDPKTYRFANEIDINDIF